MLAYLDLICILIAFVLWILIIVNMFKRTVCWGFFGLIAFFPTYYHAVKYYSGNRKVIAPLFISTTLFLIIHTFVVNEIGKNQLAPFFADVSANLNIDCKYSGNVNISPRRNTYFVWCAPHEIEKVLYRGVDEMVEVYKKNYIEPMIPHYITDVKDHSRIAIKIGIKSPYQMVGCYEIVQNSIVKSWATGLEKPCEENRSLNR